MSYDSDVLALSGLIGYWKLDESSGNAADSVGTNTGTYTGSPTLHVAGPAAGLFGVTLNGTSQYITIPDAATLDLGNSVSFVGWIKRSSSAQTDQICTKGINSWQFHASSTPSLSLLQEGVQFLEDGSTLAVDTNWHQVGFVKVTTDVRLNYDGADVSGSLTNATLANTAEALEFGRRVHDGTGYFHGSFSRFALFNRALTNGEFAALFASMNAVTVTPGVAALVTSAFAPVVTATVNQTATPGVAALVTTPFAPVVTATANQTAVPGVAALSTTAFAPVVTATANQVATPGVVALSLTPFVPSVTATANQVATPGVASLSLTSFAPAVTGGGNQLVVPNLVALSLTSFAPVVTGSGVVAGVGHGGRGGSSPWATLPPPANDDEEALALLRSALPTNWTIQ